LQNWQKVLKKYSILQYLLGILRGTWVDNLYDIILQLLFLLCNSFILWYFCVRCFCAMHWYQVLLVSNPLYMIRVVYVCLRTGGWRLLFCLCVWGVGSVNIMAVVFWAVVTTTFTFLCPAPCFSCALWVEGVCRVISPLMFINIFRDISFFLCLLCKSLAYFLSWNYATWGITN
jgi:hypothetical protein